MGFCTSFRFLFVLNLAVFMLVLMIVARQEDEFTDHNWRGHEYIHFGHQSHGTVAKTKKIEAPVKDEFQMLESSKMAKLAAATSGGDPSIPKLLIAVKAKRTRYMSSLKAIRETWGSAQHPQIKIVYFGDGADFENSVVDVNCPGEWNTGLLCCKHARILDYFNNMDSSFRWLFFVDDDSYVFPMALLKLATITLPETGGHEAAADFGCKWGSCTGNCRQSGQLVTRSTVEWMVQEAGGHYTDLSALYNHTCMGACLKEKEDVAWGHLMHNHFDVGLIVLKGWANYRVTGLQKFPKYRPIIHLHEVNASHMYVIQDYMRTHFPHDD